MSSAFENPDVKVNMSLDEIIRLNKQERSARGCKRQRRRLGRKMGRTDWRNHSIPLVSTTEGVKIFVSRNSPLLSVENRRRIAEIFSSRALNAKLLEKSKKVIPAEYKLIKTSAGVERILVPISNYFARPLRKLRNFINRAPTSKESPDKPPPLVVQPTFPLCFHTSPVDVDSPQEISVLHHISPQNKVHEVIDVESNLPVDVLEAQALFERACNLGQSGRTSLNDRFTRLSKNF